MRRATVVEATDLAIGFAVLAALAVFNVGMTMWDGLRQRGDYWPSGAHRRPTPKP